MINHKRVVLICALIILVFSSYASAWPVSLYNYEYRQQHTIDITDNQTDYSWRYAAWHDNLASHDFSSGLYNSLICTNYNSLDSMVDLLFTDDGTSIYPSWVVDTGLIEGRKTIDVLFPSVYNGMQYYIYYGNPTANNNNISAYLFPDAFSSLDASKWTISGNVTVADGICTISRDGGTDAYIIGKQNFDNDYSVIARVKFGHYQNNTYGEHMQFRGSAGVGQSFLISFFSYSTIAGKYFASRDTSGTYNYVGEMGLTPNTWYIIEMTKNGTTSGIWHVDIEETTKTSTSNLPTGAGPVAFFSQFANGAVINIDWSGIRPVKPFNNIGTWNSVEHQINPFVVEFSAIPISGNNPLTVWFEDESYNVNDDLAINCTIDSHQWYFGDSTINSTQTNPSHTYATSGIYSVTLTVSNSTYGKSNSTAYTSYISVGSGTPTPTPTPTTGTPTPTPTPTYASYGNISVYEVGSDYIIWQVGVNITDIVVDGVKRPVYGSLYGQYNLSPMTLHTGCRENAECIGVRTEGNGWYVFVYWLAFIVLICMVVISYYIPITAFPIVIYGVYLIAEYIPTHGNSFVESSLVGILIIVGILAAYRGMNR